MLCARGFLFFFLYFTILLYLQFYLFPLSCVGTIGIGCNRTGAGVLAIGGHEGVALLQFANPVGVCCDDASVKGLIV